MLNMLHIRNFALIDDLIIPWKPGLNVLTGETGAGKSIIIDAMNLLLGQRASAGVIRRGSSSAEIEAAFDICACFKTKEVIESMELDASNDELLFRRIITADGKSKCFLNGSLVTLNLLETVGESLVDMHGQHEHQSLINPKKHLALLDEFAGLGADATMMRQRYGDLKQRIATLERIIAQESHRNQRVAELREELKLIEQAGLTRGEDEEIKTRRSVIANSENIHRLIGESYDMLAGGEKNPQPIAGTWDALMHALQEVGRIDHGFAQSLREYEDIRYKLAELSSLLQDYLSRLEYDPAELDALESRLQTISKLKRRYRCESLDALLDLAEDMQSELDRLTGSSSEKNRLSEEIQLVSEQAGKLAMVLSQKRIEAANRLERNVQAHLRELGMDKARFLVSVQQEEAPNGLVTYKGKTWKTSSWGIDTVEFLMSANVGEPPKPLAAIASGGEISRIMLALRTILAETDKVPVVIFDEIDAGVGASMGMRIAEKLSTVAASRQVICITHLPQIAAMAHNHVVVDKLVAGGRTRTEISFPQGEKRIREIARMLGGDATGNISLKHAQELLALSRKSI
ncbi:MAG: DNA repair protein RecN [Candidatus Abyssobacteria bacterium SURF_5]|uniref:DNA repair protein RecN n=1 Tax=Abyssobacteria bacterium (strain SURF_5) TaxID=2093360 RepID=A0A3A4NI60_ABYX5|nr:MAG: DNA repair protein RecN [Candidatus Abyssubacteria bacterium SURF_5]